MYNQYTLSFEVYAMMTRYSSAIGMGAIATFGLLFLMQTLIVLQPGAYSEPRPEVSKAGFSSSSTFCRMAVWRMLSSSTRAVTCSKRPH